VVDGEVVKAGLQKEKEKVMITPTTLAGISIEEEIAKIGMVMRYAVREASAIMEQEIRGDGIGEASKAGILQRIATIIFIQGVRQGL